MEHAAPSRPPAVQTRNRCSNGIDAAYLSGIAGRDVC